MNKKLLNRCLPALVLTSLCLWLCLAASAQAFSPEKGSGNKAKKATIHVQHMSIADVLNELKNQTKIPLFMPGQKEQKLIEKVSLNVTDQSIEEVLAELLGKRRYAYSFKNGILTVSGDKLQAEATPPSGATAFKPLTGKVIDPAGNPVPFATITLKGAGKGVQTDSNGMFVLAGVRAGILEVRCLGFETKQISIKDNNIQVRLTEAINNLDETVIIAYGSTTRRTSTGNMYTVKGRDIETQPVSNPMQALQGRVPGLFILSSTGLSGGGITARLQGENSLKEGNDPLYIIDGVPFPSQLPNTFSNILGGIGRNASDVATQQPGSGSPLSFINLPDIMSIDILKDADATSIYGSRAANGVILVTTKKGKPGPLKVNVLIQQGISKVARKMNLLNTPQYREMRKEAFTNAGWPVPTDSTSPTMENEDLMGFDQHRYTDWQRVLIGNNAKYTNINTAASGGTICTQYLMSLGYRKETTVFPGSLADQRATAHFNINSMSANERLKVNFSGSYMLDDNRLMNEDLTGIALRLAPNAPALYLPDGKLNWGLLPDGNAGWRNPLSYLQQPYNIKTANLVASTSLNYRLLHSLFIRANAGYNNLSIKEMLVKPQNTYPPQDWSANPTEVKIANADITTWIVEPRVEYESHFLGGKLDVLVGSTFQGNNASRYTINAGGYMDGMPLQNISATALSMVSGNSAVYKYSALFTRISYNWNTKYILNLSARRDGSSRFGPASQFHNFGSIAAAWIFSEMEWLKLHVPAISFGKLKSSYGTTGNDAIGDYQFMNYYTAVSSPLPYQGTIGLEPAGLTNPYLQWEQTRKASVGLELGFFKDRLLLDVNYYHNRSSNQLLAHGVPVVTGFSNITQNINATVLNTGWELSLKSENTEHAIQWNVQFNLTVPANKLLSYPGLEASVNNNDYAIGKPTNVRKLYRFAGVYPDSGLYTVYDRSGKITTASVLNGSWEDRTAYINLNPVLYGGLLHTLKYRSLELTILFQFVKQTGANYALGDWPGTFSGGLGNQPAYLLNRWQKQGDVKPVQQVNANKGAVATYTYINTLSSTAAFSDASYIRLKQLSLQWTLPERLRQKLHMDDVRFFFEGQNLFTITGYQGLDPETLNTTSLPPLKVFTAGIKLNI